MDINVGRTTVRRARTRVLQEIMGDHIVKYELVKNDLDLGERHQLSIITDMQKGLEIVVENVLPLVEHRKCARHVLANWCKNWEGVERRRVFWRIAKSTFKAEMKDNIQAMKKLGQECLDDLLWYNLNTWCKKYFQDYSKCDVVDNNMAESFDAWILPARYKTIITILEEIRVKMIKRIGDLRKFSNTWITDISPMSLKILQENIEKSMECNLTWNGERGFEIKYHGFTHTVDIVSRSCSCRSWQLRGIPCPHGVAALHYKELEPIHYVASCYRKETYLSTYAHFIQLMNNMKMWSTSNNPIVKPPKIKKLPGRPGKVRRKKADESRKIGKLSKRGVVMTCSKSGTQGHNKRDCPTRNQGGPSQSVEPSS
ncbi:uncharacterized protein LOC125831843 [Solanum verrucosum]|uniref:uncharacterized protein LOC125831843 n=1 Tax=Solanum verrucosum TaxID=315347 RepID=UPI0020D13EB1|nr:uncharacterized protein LOC125831843 [Solanum verrucosum]